MEMPVYLLLFFANDNIINTIYLLYMDILLTNDDGIKGHGIWALYHSLSKFANVTIVAPKSNMSGIGRVTSYDQDIQIEPIEEGYVLAGTPADCVIIGLKALGLQPDIVISGCNRGANVGYYSLGRSGTISAAIEATFLGFPSISSSLFIPLGEYPYTPSPDEYIHAANATAYIVRNVVESKLLKESEYLNVNSPMTANTPPNMVLTVPSVLCEMDAHLLDEHSARVNDEVWAKMRDSKISDSPGTDRQTVIDGDISISHLSSTEKSVSSMVLSNILSSY